MSRIISFQWVFCLVCMAGIIACNDDSNKNLSYQETAQRNYYLGVQALKKENYVEAQKYFQFIKSKYDRFVKYYILADLRIADCYFYDEKYNQAIQQYRMFIKLHPNNPNVPYAMFKVAESYYKQIPDDWWFMPPSYEKDLSSATDALHEFRRFIVSFPNHEYIYAAKKLARDCEKILYSHEMFVMEYYLKRDKYRAVVIRLEEAMSNYPRLADTDANLYILIKSYINIKNYQKAKTAFQKLIDKFPSSKHIESAKNLMKQISNIN